MPTQSMSLVFFIFLCFLCNNNAYGIYLKKGNKPGHISGLIVGGVQVPIGMYPHVASLVLVGESYFCGGSIISDRVILTAAHCLVDIFNIIEPKSLNVFVGSSTFSQGDKYTVCKVVVHKSYSRISYKYDIGVVILNNRIKFRQTIQKVKIAPDESWRNEKYSFTIAGFGLTESSGIPKKLLATRMHYVDSKTCNQSQSANPMMVPDHMFCMIGQRWTSDCYGDSGSGIIWKGFIVGLVSTGREEFCGADMIPSMYTDVPYFRQWINDKIKKADSLTKRQCETLDKTF